METQEGSRVLRIFSYLGAFAKYQKATGTFVMPVSVRPHGTTHLKRDEFS